MARYPTTQAQYLAVMGENPSYFKGDRRPLNIAISVLVAVLYGRVLWGLLPANGISWEGHLFGLLSGIVIAKFASKSTGF